MGKKHQHRPVHFLSLFSPSGILSVHEFPFLLMSWNVESLDNIYLGYVFYRKTL